MRLLWISLPERFINSLGTTMIHSLWQGFLVFILVGTGLLLLGKRNAKGRYILLYSGLMVMFLLTVCSFIWLWKNAENTPSGLFAMMIQDGLPHVSLHIAGSSYTFFQWLIQRSSLLIRHFFPYFPVMVFFWLAGVILLAGRMGAGLWTVYGLKRNGITKADAWITEVLIQQYGPMQINKTVGIAASSKIEVPMVIGWIKPMILLPLSVVGNLSVEQMESIIAHELAHIRRNDFLLNLIQLGVETLLFYHPLFWWLSSKINQEREQCCDDLVLQHNKFLPYIKALTYMQEQQFSSNLAAQGLIGHKSSLLKRIRRMVLIKPTTSPTRRLVTAGLSFLFILLITFAVFPSRSSVPDPLTEGLNSGISPLDTTCIHKIMNATVKSKYYDKKEGREKEMQIVFAGDTVKEIEVDGKKVLPENQGEYHHVIEGIRKNYNESVESMERAENNMEKAQDSLALEQEEFEEQQSGLDHLDFERMMNEVQRSLDEALKSMDNLKWSGEDREQLREQMTRAREETQRAMEKFRREDMEKFRQAMSEARDQLRKSLDEFYREHPEGYHIEIHIPPISVPPCPSDTINETHSTKDTHSMESTLEDLEKK